MALSVALLQSNSRSRTRFVLGSLLLLGLAAGLGAGEAAVAGHPEAIFGLTVLFLPILAWRWPQVTVVFAVGVATLVEQFPLSFPDRLTDRIPLLRTLNSVGLAGLQTTPMELILLIVVAVWLARSLVERDVRLPRSGLAYSIYGLAAVIAFYELYGIARGGNFQASVWELRGWFYLFAVFFMAARFLQTPKQVNAVVWMLVIGIGLKGIQGTVRYLFFVRGVSPAPDAILEHPEAFSFGIFVAIFVAVWIYGLSGRLRAVTTVLLPFVVLADLANNRRAAWIVLAASIAIVSVFAWLRMPERRRMLAAVGTMLAIAAAVYLPLEWHGTGVLAQPARAIASAFSPSARDESSDFYRLQENYNLAVLIHSSPIVGAGFGQRISQAIPLWDASNVDPLIDYIPHNQILYLWVRLGTPGVLAFWLMIGMGFLTATRLVRLAQDRQALLVGALAACALAGYLVEAWLDQGLVAPRVTIQVGALLGCVYVLLSRIRTEDESAIPTAIS